MKRLKENSRWFGHAEFNCFLVLYSITDRRSFDRALEYMDLILNHELTATRAVILVANKNDMERSRMVGTREGELAAEMRRCVFMNISVMINHQIDELLLELMAQLKKGHIARSRRASSLRPPGRNQRNHSGDFPGERQQGSVVQGGSPRESIWARIRRSSFRRRMSKSCENLL
ncbi:hypothetical protein HELRODRAFT_105504 [Helobdella robusta]|uniref:Uncharacterized protein n=1 Tax=Helobdella robusta TaxID=6412 RepID=T1EDW0_HELRO|nr:hypothetical protein HELRODRAFT_105504 [Helobdella robusta]ESO12760.1 hypothetical protein HELRODRAFT_105504 [Helobdella robusta]